jgi:hypothetical protein
LTKSRHEKLNRDLAILKKENDH